MKPVFEKVPRRDWESFHCEIIRGPDYESRWHFHPEYQITLALSSRGHRVVGDRIAPLVDGDVVLVGSNLPHVWHQDEHAEGEVHAIVVRFDPAALGKDFFALPELEPVRRLLKNSIRGYEVRGKTRETVALHLQRLAESEGMARLLELLSILHLLAASPRELKTLASAAYTPKLESADQAASSMHTSRRRSIGLSSLASLI
jgi:hypothetical protein